jgi:small subunit ribosomal protein S6
MRKYETIFIINPDLTEEESKTVIDKVKDIIQSVEGEVLKVEEWGKKKLAYDIRKMSRGLFVLLHFQGSAQGLTELERNLRLMDEVLKYQTVKLDEKTEKMAHMLSREKPPETEEKPEAEAESQAEQSPKQEEEPKPEAEEPAPEKKEESAEPEGKKEEEAPS